MTYGTASAELRDAISQLVAYRRTFVNLGGAHGVVEAKATPLEIRADTDLMLRFRAIVWDCALTALRVAVPQPHAPRYEPAARLLHHVETTRPPRDLLPAGRDASGLELGSTWRFPLVEAWRRVAVAAIVTSERELPLLRTHLDQAQRTLLIRDATDVVRALVRLDDRYRHLPGWQRLGGRATGTQTRPRRGRTVRSVGLYTSAMRSEEWAAGQITDASYTLDRLGHRPAPMSTTRVTSDGIDSAVDALNSAWRRLHHEFPNWTSMASILRLNRLIAAHGHRLAVAAGEPALAEFFATRAGAYLRLLNVAENVAGKLGRGQAAVADITAAVKRLGAETTPGHDDLLALAEACGALDAGISTLLSRGADERLYFVTHATHMGTLPARGIVPAVREYVALTRRSHPAYFGALEALRPAPLVTELDVSGAAGRAAFREVIDTGFSASPAGREHGATAQVGASRWAIDAVSDSAFLHPEPAGIEAEAAGIAM